MQYLAKVALNIVSDLEEIMEKAEIVSIFPETKFPIREEFLYKDVLYYLENLESFKEFLILNHVSVLTLEGEYQEDTHDEWSEQLYPILIPENL